MMIPVLLGVTLVVFSMLYFSPGKAADYILGDLATAEQKALFNKENGLDKPFFVQYVNYVIKACKGDLGTSYITKRPVLQEILVRFPNTLSLAFVSMVFATILGVSLGIISATKQYTIWDNVTRVLSIIGVSMPSFWEGLMLILLFSVVLRWLPPSGFNNWKQWVMPVLTIGTSAAATIMRMTRSSMLEAIRQDYVRMARAKGQSETVVIWKHALKNAMIPVMTVIGLNFGRLLGGIAISETVFAVPGVGKLIVDAIPVKNAPLVQGGILFIAFAMSIINLITDVLYAYVDPRIRSQYVKRRARSLAKAAQG
jgi:peptide/nickel transport system permease protein